MTLPFSELLDAAISARAPLFDVRKDATPHAAFRLLNGFSEGCPALAIDIYGATALIHNYADTPEQGQTQVTETQQILLARLPWLHTVVLKTRNAGTEEARRGTCIYGSTPDAWVREHGVRYSIDLMMNRDASLYLDTRNLREWALQNLAGKSVLNTFAYTGSLGVAAKAAGAARVVHLDLNRQFLNLAKTSYTLNGFPIQKADFLAGDFWPLTNRLKRNGETFDCVLLDPPFFAATARGVVDLASNSTKLINKVRPLINHGGILVAINNALFLSGTDYIKTLEALCADGYLAIEARIPVPEDFIGYPQTRTGAPVTDPAPFNHATKIAILRVRRK